MKEQPVSFIKMPLHLAYVGASTIEDAEGRIIAECPDNDTASILVLIVNYAQEASVTDRPAILERLTLHNLFRQLEEGNQ